MTQRCLVPNCNSRSTTYGNTIAFFNVPTDNELRKKWTEAIPKIGVPLYRTDLICEKHFFESDIIRQYIVQDPAGHVIDKVAYEYPQLAESAVPSIFPGFELQLKQPRIENKPPPIVVQKAPDAAYNYLPPPTAPPELDIVPVPVPVPVPDSSATRINDNIRHEVATRPSGWNISDGENPSIGWDIPEVTKHLPDSKVNRIKITENHVPVSEPRMVAEPIPVTFYPPTIVPASSEDSYNTYGGCCEKCGFISIVAGITISLVIFACAVSNGS